MYGRVFRTMISAYRRIASLWNAGWIRRRCPRQASPSFVRSPSPSATLSWRASQFLMVRSCSRTSTCSIRSGWLTRQQRMWNTRKATTSPYSRAHCVRKPRMSRRNSGRLPISGWPRGPGGGARLVALTPELPRAQRTWGGGAAMGPARRLLGGRHVRRELRVKGGSSGASGERGAGSGASRWQSGHRCLRERGAGSGTHRCNRRERCAPSRC